MRCYKCGSFLTDGDTCPQCGENVRIYKKTARVSDAYYNAGLYKARVRDLTGAVESDADDLDSIVKETLGAVESERTSRVIDHEGAGSMERRKREGYF